MPTETIAQTVAHSVTHNTFVIERTYLTTPQRVFAALSDPAKKQRWSADGEGVQVESFSMDFRVGGRETKRFTSSHDSPVKGLTMENDSVYLDIVQDSRVVLAYTMAVADRRISASLSTFELIPTEGGTKLVYTEQASFFENSDGPDMRKFGWSLLLNQLGTELAAA